MPKKFNITPKRTDLLSPAARRKLRSSSRKATFFNFSKQSSSNEKETER